MLCCAIILALICAPAMALRSFLKPAGTDPLAWRLVSGAQAIVPPAKVSQPPQSFLKTRARSFAYAGAGIWHVVSKEQSSAIHAAATIAAVASGFAFRIGAEDWRWVAIAVFAVWSAEAFNTAIESTCNLLSPDFSEHARIAKDTAAGAVLLVSIGAAVIGAMTFWPYFAPLLASDAWPPGLSLALCRSEP